MTNSGNWASCATTWPGSPSLGHTPALSARSEPAGVATGTNCFFGSRKACSGSGRAGAQLASKIAQRATPAGPEIYPAPEPLPAELRILGPI